MRPPMRKTKHDTYDCPWQLVPGGFLDLSRLGLPFRGLPFVTTKCSLAMARRFSEKSIEVELLNSVHRDHDVDDDEATCPRARDRFGVCAGVFVRRNARARARTRAYG